MGDEEWAKYQTWHDAQMAAIRESGKSTGFGGGNGMNYRFAITGMAYIITAENWMTKEKFDFEWNP